MYILLGIAALILVLIAGIVIAASMRPTDIHYQRSITTTASAETVFAIFSGFRAAGTSGRPTRKKTRTRKPPSPTRPRTSAHATRGRQQGSRRGPYDHHQYRAGRSVDMRLEFDRPFKCEIHVEWRVDDEGDARRISWTMDGKDAPDAPDRGLVYPHGQNGWRRLGGGSRDVEGHRGAGEEDAR